MITRRSFIVSSGIAAAGMGVVSAVAHPVGYDEHEPDRKSAAPVARRPAWLKEGIVVADYIEPLMFRQRMGGWGADVVEEWNEAHTERTVKRLKDLGVTLIITNLFRGFGLKAETQDFESNRALTELAHRYGIRVAGYVGASMMTETFFDEEPEARNWMQVDEWGHPIYYSQTQTWRYMACRNNPGYRSYIERVIRLGIQDLKLDMLHFDQVEWWPEPLSCHCRYCNQQFRTFLRERYNDEQLKLRCGLRSLDRVVAPPFGLTEPPVRFAELTDPLTQEWTRFRATSLAQRWAEYDNLVQELNPEVALIGNPNFHFGLNKGFVSGIDPEQLLRHGDGVWDEGRNYAAWTDDGRLISKIASYKVARIMGQSLYVYHGRNFRQQTPGILSLAEALAYNNMNLGVIAADDVTGVAVPELSSQAKEYITFFHNHAKDLVDTVSIADVAVFHSFPSVEFNPSQSLLSTVIFEQTLIQTRVPFDIIFSTHLKDLSKYKVLVLANQDALSDQEVAEIRKFVENGGGLVATERSSFLTDWRLIRWKFGLAEVLGIDVPPTPDQPDKVIRREFGKGRAAYVPRIEFSTNPPPPQMNYYVSSDYWTLPKNYQDLVDAVTWAARDELSVTVDAPKSVTLELAEQRSTRTRLLHLVNYNFTQPVRNLAVSLRLPPGVRVQEILLDSPDGEGSAKLTFSPTQGGLVSFTVPQLKLYDLTLCRTASA